MYACETQKPKLETGAATGTGPHPMLCVGDMHGKLASQRKSLPQLPQIIYIYMYRQDTTLGAGESL